MKSMKKEILILGNSGVALSAIRTIRRVDKKINVAVIAKENEPFYSPVLLPYYIQGKISKPDLCPLGFEFYEKNSVEIFCGEKVRKVSGRRKNVLLESGAQFDYEKLIIATGASSFVPPIKGIKNKGIFSLRTAEDADLILEHPGRRVVIVGAGAVGIGVAIALRKKGLEVAVLDQIDISQFLGGMVDLDIAKEIVKNLEENGIKIFLEQNALEMEFYGNPVQGIRGNRLDLACDTAILATGVKPNLAFIDPDEIFLGVKGGILVDERMMSSCPDVYAGGDCVEAVNSITGRRENNPIWPNAIEQGKIAALNLLGIRTAYRGFIKENVINLFDKVLFIAGEMQGEKKCYDERQKLFRIIFRNGVIRGCQILGPPEKYGIYIRMIKEGYETDPVSPLLGKGVFWVSKWRGVKKREYTPH
jgi:NADPH-dependent 2,4-dienoyl-CoA reductase/sulfur reductase-like enzyme